MPPSPNINVPPASSPSNPLSVAILPSAPESQRSPPTINLQISQRPASHLHSNVMGGHIAEAISSVNPSTVNVVGQDQINVNAQIYVNPDLNAGMLPYRL
jgi:hypothetical protein